MENFAWSTAPDNLDRALTASHVGGGRKGGRGGAGLDERKRL